MERKHGQRQMIDKSEFTRKLYNRHLHIDPSEFEFEIDRGIRKATENGRRCFVILFTEKEYIINSKIICDVLDYLKNLGYDATFAYNEARVEYVLTINW